MDKEERRVQMEGNTAVKESSFLKDTESLIGDLVFQGPGFHAFQVLKPIKSCRRQRERRVREVLNVKKKSLNID